jgi:hypothetical protein
MSHKLVFRCGSNTQNIVTDVDEADLARAAASGQLRAMGVEALSAAEEFTPEDSYREGIARLKAANATPLSTFEDQYKAARLRELDAEHPRLAEHVAAEPRPRLTAAEVAKFKAPDPYRDGLSALKLKENR